MKEVFVKSFDKHLEIKKPLLEEFDQLDYSTATLDKSDNDYITKTDFNYKDKDNLKYQQVLKPLFVKHLLDLFKDYNCIDLEIINMWFQQYQQNDTHHWHTHINSHFSCVYFVELPDTNIKTEIQSFYKKKHKINYKVKEGDILTFPSYLYHRSPPNIVDRRKTIVSFNINIY
tara:strand:+ start:40 stop:558 length:519 start_codon:yes stop_codon:yes gene_type:complete